MKLVVILKDKTLEDAKVSAYLILSGRESLVRRARIIHEGREYGEFTRSYRKWSKRWKNIEGI